MNSGTGTFTIYQDVCLIPNRIYNTSFNLGITLPKLPAVPPKDPITGCNVVFQLNNVSVARQVPICELVTAANPFGICHVPSYDPFTKYIQHSLIFSVENPVTRVGIFFNCTSNDPLLGNAQGVLDQWQMIPQPATVVATS